MRLGGGGARGFARAVTLRSRTASSVLASRRRATTTRGVLMSPSACVCVRAFLSLASHECQPKLKVLSFGSQRAREHSWTGFVFRETRKINQTLRLHLIGCQISAQVCRASAELAGKHSSNKCDLVLVSQPTSLHQVCRRRCCCCCFNPLKGLGAVSVCVCCELARLTNRQQSSSACWLAGPKPGRIFRSISWCEVERRQ